MLHRHPGHNRYAPIPEWVALTQEAVYTASTIDASVVDCVLVSDLVE